MSELAFPADPPTGLAIAYVPARLRVAFTLLLQIDHRFSDIVQSAREPMIAQIKMAWWREAFGKAPQQRPKGEPLLQALNQAHDLIPSSALEALVVAWEMLLGIEEWTPVDVDSHAAQRAEAVFQTYAKWIGSAHDVRPIGQVWALETLRMAFPNRVPDSMALSPPSLPKARALRPLSILSMSVRTKSGPRLVWHALTGL